MFMTWMGTKMESLVKVELDCLRQDHATLAQILEERRSVTTVTLPASARILWSVYLLILEDALKTINSLITFLASKS